MHQSSNHSKFQRMRRRLDLFRQKKEEQSVSHPLRACLPFLCATGVLMTTVVTAASCTMCYRVDAQGQSLAFFHDVEPMTPPCPRRKPGPLKFWRPSIP